MKTSPSESALRRVIDALEAELLGASDAEIMAVAAETGMNAGALLSDVGGAPGLMSVRTDLKTSDDADQPADETTGDPVAPGRRPHSR